ncbi:antitoxin VapB family protein [Haloarcula sp. H-GB4]|nr:antitoxin VapB family protein [Haloarcula sp. H-GB4]MDQ2072830.1 antitoxin VapB family protein [Haloarcula sp. H-GB4]
MGRTTIQVSDELADELHDRKSRGDSYEDVIWRLIEERDGQEDGSDE